MIEIFERLTLAIKLKPWIESIKAFCKTCGGTNFWQKHQQKSGELGMYNPWP
jgi:hypothetical protein